MTGWLLASQARLGMAGQARAGLAALADHSAGAGEADRLVLPFAMTGSRELLEALPRQQTAHAALLTGILDVLRGESPATENQSALPETEELSLGELRVLRYLPTNLSRPEIATELSVSVNTVSTHPQHLRQAQCP